MNNMREIKFRAWAISTNDGRKEMFDWQTYGTLICEWIVNKERNAGIMQFTGLHDKNGKEIYEGDIVTCEGGYETGDGCEAPREVKWNTDSLQFIVVCNCHNDEIPLFEFDANEIIGNIYENPELIK